MRRGCGCRYPSFACACETEPSALLVSALENSHHRLEGKTMTTSRDGERLKRKH